MDEEKVTDEKKNAEVVKEEPATLKDEKEKQSKPLKPPVISTKVLLVLVVIAVVFVGALGALAYNNYRDTKKIKPAMSATPSPIPSLAVGTASPDRVVDEGVTWLTPQKITDQELFEKSGEDSAYTSTDYYKVGTTLSGGEIILARVNLDAMMGGNTPIHRIIKNGDSYKRIVQNSAEINNDGYFPTKKLTDDSSYVFKSLVPDKIISKDQTDLISVQNPSFPLEKDPESETKKITSTKWGDLYLELAGSYSANDVNQDSSDKTPIVKVARYFIKLNDSTEMSYEVRPKFLRDDNTFDLDYKETKVDGQKYDKFEMGGCGFGLGVFPYLVDSDSLKNNDLIGTQGGSSVYGITNPENKTINYAYMLYKSDNAPGKIDISEFISNFGLVYFVDAYGSPIAYLKSDYKPAIECGKPVVYLYPEKKIDFKVTVGADVTKSEPLYEKFWQGVAYPDGKLEVDGKDYPNLFWEGKGIGQYPKVDFGKVVKSDDVKLTIVSDLKAMSLNDQEISDFLGFWLEKMPKTPYTRISWLTNFELNKLAPLSVKPKPDSVIRVFMDFAPLNTKAEIKNQSLPKFQRKGFTVVEWGGLLKK